MRTSHAASSRSRERMTWNFRVKHGGFDGFHQLLSLMASDWATQVTRVRSFTYFSFFDRPDSVEIKL